MSRGARFLPVLALVGAGLAGCSADPNEDVLTVFAAASLRGPFEELGAQFESEHPGVDVAFNFAGSSDLAAQVREGADADVIATADPATMTTVADEDLLASPPRTFASNTLQIAVPAGNPADIVSLSDLSREDVALVVCAPVVPCGAAGQRVAQAAGIDLQPVSEEQSVTDVLNKVSVGEADAGLVYVSDVLAAGDKVIGIEIPDAATGATDYPIASLADSDEPELAAEFVDLVTGPTGRAALDRAGFGQP